LKIFQHSLIAYYTKFKMINVWCRSRSRWLTFSHFTFTVAMLEKVYLCMHSATATIDPATDKHLS